MHTQCEGHVLPTNLLTILLAMAKTESLISNIFELSTLKGIKALNENSTKCFGANRIIMGSFQHYFIDLAY